MILQDELTCDSVSSRAIHKRQGKYRCIRRFLYLETSFLESMMASTKDNVRTKGTHGRSNSHGSNKSCSITDSMFFLPSTSTILRHISIHDSHIFRPPVYIFTAMSTHNSPKPSLESLRKRLESLHKIRYNLDAHFISIRQDVGVMIDQHLDTRDIVCNFLLRRACNNYYRRTTPHMPHLLSDEVDGGIPTGRSYLKEIETRMSERMKNLRDLRGISEFG